LGNTNFTPKEIKEILDVVAEQNIMRQLATVYTIAGDGVVPVPGLGTATWGADGSTITPADPTITPVTFGAYTLQGAFQVNDALMEDDFYSVAKMISQVVGGTLAENEGSAMISGDGTGKPQGIFTKTADTTTAGSGVVTANELVAFLDSLDTKYRTGDEVLLMNPKFLGVIGGLVDTSKKLELDRTTQRLNGIKYVLTSLAPAPAANTNVLVFGNLKRGYAIAQRGGGIAQKRVPASNAFVENILFAERVDGRIVDGNAFKVLKLKV